MRETPDGAGVQIFEQNQPGAMGEVFLIQPGSLGASAASAYIRGQEGIIDPITGRTRLIGGLSDLNRWLQDDPNLNLNHLRHMTLEDWHRARFD